MSGKKSALPDVVMGQNARLQVFTDAQALAQAAASMIVDHANQCIFSKGVYHLLLAGGSTPQAVYRGLSSVENRHKIPWERVHLFWGDERCVPRGHPHSNYRLAAESLLANLSIPDGNIHRIAGELNPHLAAEMYEKEILVHFDSAHTGQDPMFDLVLLGLGEDGHTASLFPASPALQVISRWVVGVEHTTPPPPLVARVSVTFRLLNAAQRVVFLVSGAAKREILARVLSGTAATEALLPAQRVRPAGGEVIWLVDQQAAGSGAGV